MAGSNLRADIENLLNFKPSYTDEDPEELFGFGEDSRLVIEDVDEINDDEGQRDSQRSVSRKLRIMPEIEMTGPEYSGKQSSRKLLLGEDEGDKLAGTQTNLNEAAFLEAMGDESDEEEIPGKVDESLDKEMEALDREYAQLRQEEEEVLKSVKPRSDDDRKKGKAIEMQKEMWDRTLEIRIFLQKSLQMGHKLPSPLCRKKSRKAFSDVSGSSRMLLNSIFDLQMAVCENNPTLASSLQSYSNENGKRSIAGVDDSLDAIWQRMDSWNSSFVSFRNTSVDRWQRKTQLSSGGASGGNLRALNQTVSEQVKAAMANPGRLIDRTRLKKSTLIEGANQAQGEEGEEGELDFESFDDSEFYQQLLREFLEASEASGVGGQGLRSLKKLRNTKKKVVDHRASKERKIRYTVVPELVNFMAPQPAEIPSVALKLFGSLFGQKQQSIS